MLYILDENDRQRKKSKDALVKTLEEMEKNIKPLASQSNIAGGYLQKAEVIKVFSKLRIISVYIISYYEVSGYIPRRVK